MDGYQLIKQLIESLSYVGPYDHSNLKEFINPFYLPNQRALYPVADLKKLKVRNNMYLTD